MYFPADVACDLHFSVSVDRATIVVEHDYTLTPVRRAILRAKIARLLTPLIEELRMGDALPEEWPEIMRLLTVNLLDEQRFPPAISWLGLSFAVQMGNSGIEAWRGNI